LANECNGDHDTGEFREACGELRKKKRKKEEKEVCGGSIDGWMRTTRIFTLGEIGV
jgi:hypothetical protein